MFFLLMNFQKFLPRANARRFPTDSYVDSETGGMPRSVCSIEKYSFWAEIWLSGVKFLAIAAQLCRQLYENFLNFFPAQRTPNARISMRTSFSNHVAA
jgi:hypothetical protein